MVLGSVRHRCEWQECLPSLSPALVKLLEYERDLVTDENLILQLLDLVLRPKLLVNLYVKGDTQRLAECAAQFSAASLRVRRGTSLGCVHEQLLLFAYQEVEFTYP